MSNNPSKAKHKLFGHDESSTSTTVPKKSKFEKPTFSSTNSASKGKKKLVKGTGKNVKQVNNNNAVSRLNLPEIAEVPLQTKQPRSKKLSIATKLVPIIQTRRMKQKAKDNVEQTTQNVDQTFQIVEDDLQAEINRFNSIDTLSSKEISDGDKTANDVVDHDGVELSVNGSDDEFAAEEGATETDAAEPGELQSSGEESSPVRRVPSKVVKVSRAKPTNNTSLAGGAHKNMQSLIICGMILISRIFFVKWSMTLSQRKNQTIVSMKH